MKNLTLLLLLFIVVSYAFSQYTWDYGISIGAANYLGELGGKEKTRRNFIFDLKLSQTRTAIGGFARYQNDFKAYIFTGVAVFYNNPKAFYNGSWVALGPLHTEGQSIIPGAPKPYSKIQLAIPAGAGFYFTFQKKFRIGWEFNWRTTFTDYIDDASSVYVDPTKLNSETAAALSNRNPELGDYSDQDGIAYKDNYTPGAKRGDPSHKDSYLSTTINLSYAIQGTSNFAKTKYRSFFKSKKFSRRTIRAKF
jgi:hypothetical protein